MKHVLTFGNVNSIQYSQRLSIVRGLLSIAEYCSLFVVSAAQTRVRKHATRCKKCKFLIVLVASHTHTHTHTLCRCGQMPLLARLSVSQARIGQSSSVISMQRQSPQELILWDIPFLVSKTHGRSIRDRIHKANHSDQQVFQGPAFALAEPNITTLGHPRRKK